MTLWDLLRSMIRLWPVVIVGALLTVAAAYFAAQDRSVYWTRTEVVFLAPSSTMYPNALETRSEDLVVTAGAVAKVVSGPAKHLKFTSPDAGVIGESIRQGWSVRLPDTGGQWAPNFVDQLLIVEVVGPDPTWVTTQKDELVDRIRTTLAAMQKAQGVAPVNTITTTAAPAETVVYPVTGSRMRAFVMTGVLGAGATLWLALVLSYRRARRLSARPAPPVPAGPRTVDRLEPAGTH
jgi:hypothetical protein